MNKLISEGLMIDLEALTISSAAGATSINYDMQKYDQAGIVVNVNSTGFTTATVDLMEATAATAAGSSDAAGRAGVTLGAQGGTGITTAGGVRSMTLTLASATGATYTLAVGGVSRALTQTATTTLTKSSAQTTALIYFGSSVGTTVAGGIKAHLDDLTTKLTNVTYGFGGAIQTATNATNTLKLTVMDSASGPITFTGGAAAASMSVTVQQAVAAFDLRADQFSTGGYRWVAAKVSSAATACNVGVCVVRQPGRYMPSGNFKGELST